MTSTFSFAVLAVDGAARVGSISTPRGAIRTPAFMPVGTAATVKAMHPEAVRALGADVVLSNTYHLMLAPGAERIAALGGLHKFMGWPHPILTDFGRLPGDELAKLRKLASGRRVPVAYRRVAPRTDGRSARWRSSACSALISRCSSTNAFACPVRPGGRASNATLPALGGALAGGVRRTTRPRDLRHRSRRGGKGVRIESGARSRRWISGYAIGGLAVGEPQAHARR